MLVIFFNEIESTLNIFYIDYSLAQKSLFRLIPVVNRRTGFSIVKCRRNNGIGKSTSSKATKKVLCKTIAFMNNFL